MATATAARGISLETYLQTSYRPDREYIDGEVRERNAGKYEHARIQALLALWFGQHEEVWSTIVVTECRTQVTASRVRIPDVMLLAAGPQPDVIVDPPILVVEILSPDDNYSDTESRAKDYLVMGVKAVWIIDPGTRTGRLCRGNAWIASPRLEVEGTAIYLELTDVFRSWINPVRRNRPH